MISTHLLRRSGAYYLHPWLTLLVGLAWLMPALPARATISVSITRPVPIKPNQDVTFQGQVQGAPDGSAYWWVIRDANGRVVDQEQATAYGVDGGPAHMTYTWPKEDVKIGRYSISLEVYQDGATIAEHTANLAVGTQQYRHVTPVAERPTNPPIHGAKIAGPSTVKTGEIATWEGVPNGGQDQKYEWHIRRNGTSSNRTVLAKHPGKLTTRFRTPGDYTLILWVWDKHAPKSDARIYRHEVHVIEETAAYSAQRAKPRRTFHKR